MGNDTSAIEETPKNQPDTATDEDASEEAIAAYFNTKFKVILSPDVFKIRYAQQTAYFQHTSCCLVHIITMYVGKLCSGEIIQIRRYFHSNPELKYKETNTATNLASYLEELGIETTTNVAETGVVGLLRGEHEGPCIMLRAGNLW